MGGGAAAGAGSGCPYAAEAAAAAAGGADKLTTLQCIQVLGKSRLSFFVTSTATVGYVIAGGTSPLVAVAVTLGTYCQSVSACTVNQWIEVEYDRQMKRTQHRPLVTGVVSNQFALTLAAAEVAAGTALLCAVCPVAAGLGLVNWWLYVGMYTPMKRWSTVNTWWGAVIGAFPPVMGGVAAVGGSLTAPAVYPAYVLGAILFGWQIPHFMALAFHCRRDYEKAGFKMIAFTHPRRASMYAVALSAALAVVTVPGLAYIGIAVEPWYYAVSGLANAGMVYKSVRFHMDPVRYCRSCFVYSYIYLGILMVLLTVNHFQPMGAAVRLYKQAVAEPEAPAALKQ
jgi:protoheme IX farnesyltransferase